LLFRTRVTRHQGGQTSRARDALAGAPDIPTVAQFVPGYEFSFWTGIGAPRNTPAAIVDKLNTSSMRLSPIPR
jgi:tripartite-type tricarboxylate transporter receptor subunit TctC